MKIEALNIMKHKRAEIKTAYADIKRESKRRGEAKKDPPVLTLDKITRLWRIAHSWVVEVFKYMQTNYSNKAVIRDLEKTRTNFEAFMGD